MWHWPFLAGLASSASRCRRAGLGQCPKVWDLGAGKGLLLASGHFLSQADIDQLKRIMEVVGTPSPEVLAKISSEHVSHQLPSSRLPLLTMPSGTLEGGALWE